MSETEALRESSTISGLRSWYSAPIAKFLSASDDTVLGALTAHSGFAVEPLQRDAWLAEMSILRDALAGLDGGLFLEFSIPRMGRRIDVVIVIRQLVFVIEFKVGTPTFNRAAREQVWDYALDLKNFHEASHDVPIVPVLVATEHSGNSPAITLQPDDDAVYHPIEIGVASLRAVIDAALENIDGPAINLAAWPLASYRPTPTIVEAARALYAQHSVEAIARHDAGARNLRITSERLDDIVDLAMAQREKVICFVTGVPGAGKTLAGLNVATRHRRELDKPTHAVFLSGNDPLVAVLREALTRDEVSRRKISGEKATKVYVGKSVQAFIQNVRHFRDECLIDHRAPSDRVVIFDEAQRAWNQAQCSSFMKRKRNRHDFHQSEPEFLISSMDRHPDWAVIICLVGGGQEINTGEAGIAAWFEAVERKFRHWHIYVSPRLTDHEYVAGRALQKAGALPNTRFDEALHLSVSMRSFRAENVSGFVKAVLDGEVQEARTHFARLAMRFPIVITRDLAKAKQWVRERARGSERYGLLASSSAQRLKPHAIDVRVDIDPVHYFLGERDDTRSSYYLEDAATEFQVQGLELDWACVTWDADLRFGGDVWNFCEFRGKDWCRVHKRERQQFLLNAYRVLLTRARQGMAIFVPPGDSRDHTRLPAVYDSTYEFLRSTGMPTLD